MSLVEDQRTLLFDGLRQGIYILQRMKLALSWKMQTWTGVEAFQRGAIKTSHFRKSGAMRGGQFVLENFHFAIWRHKQVAIYSLEFAVDLFVANGRFDPIDCRRMALPSQTRSFFAE